MPTKITGTVSGEPLIEVEIGGAYVPWKQGIQNWASITATTGSPTKAAYTDANGVAWTYYQWTGNGSVTTTAGIVDCFLISGGCYGSSTYDGSGGRVLSGVHQVTAATHTVTVGAGGTGTLGGESVLGPLRTAVSSLWYGGAGGTTTGVEDASSKTGITSSITGSSVTYGAIVTSPVANRGNGGDGSGVGGSSGTVILRVPTAFAQA